VYTQASLQERVASRDMLVRLQQVEQHAIAVHVPAHLPVMITIGQCISELTPRLAVHDRLLHLAHSLSDELLSYDALMAEVCWSTGIMTACVELLACTTNCSSVDKCLDGVCHASHLVYSCRCFNVLYHRRHSRWTRCSEQYQLTPRVQPPG